jgi:hypothetical protein
MLPIPSADYSGTDSFKFKATDDGPRDSEKSRYRHYHGGDAARVSASWSAQTSVLRAPARKPSAICSRHQCRPAGRSTRPLPLTSRETQTHQFSAQARHFSDGTDLCPTRAATALHPDGGLKDNGGTADGGVDTSTPKSFTINIRANQPPTANTVSPAANEDNAVMIAIGGPSRR